MKNKIPWVHILIKHAAHMFVYSIFVIVRSQVW